MKGRFILFCICCLLSIKPVFSQESAINALVNNVLSLDTFEKQQTRHIAINDSLFRTDNIRTEFNYLNKMIESTSNRKLNRMLAVTEVSRGNLLLEMGNHFKAIESFQKASDLFVSEKDFSGSNTAQSNLGNAYYYLGDLDKAMWYYKRSIDEYKKIKVIKPYTEGKLANIYNNLGIIYATKSDYLFGKVYFDRALAIWQRQNDTISIAYIYNNYANIYLSQDKMDSAYKYFKLALDLKMKHGVKSDIIDANNNLADYYSQVHDLKNALKYARTAYALLDTSQYTTDLANTYNNLAAVYEKIGDAKNSLKFYKLLTIARDTLKNRSETDNISKLELKNEFDKIHLSDSIRSVEELKIRDLKIEQERRQSLFLVLTLLLTIVALGLIYSRFKTTKKQKSIIEQQKNIVDEKNKEITDSINYAKRLQDAILPSEHQIASHVKDCFVIYSPKDIVSGDFYFFEKKRDTLFIAAADCTGHGVPGAMLSIACYNALQRAIIEFDLSEPGKILDAVKKNVVEHFNKTENNINDGMDVSLLAINYAEKKAEWAGANNRLFYIQNDVLTEVKPDRQPVGKSDSDKPFTTQRLVFLDGTIFYLFTDGMVDQFGGENSKKFTVNKLRSLLEDIKGKELADQKQILSDVINNWKGKNEQTDDVTVLGVRI